MQQYLVATCQSYIQQQGRRFISAQCSSYQNSKNYFELFVMLIRDWNNFYSFRKFCGLIIKQIVTLILAQQVETGSLVVSAKMNKRTSIKQNEQFLYGKNLIILIITNFQMSQIICLTF